MSDSINRRIEAAIDELATRVGSIWADPIPTEIRDIFAKYGLLIVLANPADAFEKKPEARE